MRRSLRALAGLLLGALLHTSADAAVLVGRYTFSDAGDLGSDSSGFGNHLENLGATQTAGHIDGSFGAQFDGDDLMQRIGGMTGYDGLPGFTFAAWVYMSAPNPNDYYGILSQDFGSCCNNRLLISPQPGLQPYINVGRHDDAVVGATLPLETWFHIVMTGVPDAPFRQGHVYVNGVEVLNSPHTFAGTLPDFTGVNTYLGAGEGGGPYRMFGALDDVEIYNGALNGDEVAELYRSQLAADIPEPMSIALLSLGLAGLGLARRRSRAAHQARR